MKAIKALSEELSCWQATVTLT